MAGERRTRLRAATSPASWLTWLCSAASSTAAFIATVFSHFTQRAIRYAASMGVPLADMLVPLSGIIAAVGGVGILIGYRAKVGALLVVLFLVPDTLIMHRFWGLSDPLLAEMQQINFMKNLALLGGALLIAYFGSGPLSLDKVTNKVTKA